MDKYLLEILKNVNTIIIPGLGALTITDHDTGEIMFMSYLKHDDGKLVSYIVENEGMDELDAKNLIAKYVREIQLTVDKGESYDMFQFGSFFKNGDEIDFKNWEGDKTSELKDNAEEIVAPQTEEKISVFNESNSEKSEETTFSYTEENIEEKEEEKEEEEEVVEEVEEKTEPVVLHLKEETEEEPKKEFNILEKEEQAATAAKLEKLKAEKEKSKTKKKKSPAFWMLLVLIALIVSGGVYFGLNYDHLKQHVPFLADKKEPVVRPEGNENEFFEENNTEEESLENSEELIEEEEEEEEVIPELIEEEVIEPVIEKETVTNINSDGDLPFHIIAGAFSSEDNANRLGEKLRSEGYNVKVGSGRGMTLVSIKSFATRAEAQSGLNELKSIAPNGWIYEWK